MADPTFSVLLPTHNRPEVLPYAIESVLAQTLPDFELLIVGDGCTDATAAVVARRPDRRVQRPAAAARCHHCTRQPD